MRRVNTLVGWLAVMVARKAEVKVVFNRAYSALTQVGSAWELAQLGKLRDPGQSHSRLESLSEIKYDALSEL